MKAKAVFIYFSSTDIYLVQYGQNRIFNLLTISYIQKVANK
ncbi:hypothetical protein MuYL_0941 [Mucilaginibacter xinganensis]|uniref:Uncharacterized protein n=1 Tax=Mucilaginibacter xinganensis TaxID=1234841 RepID=A0A223NTL6_9SPHI|nr:hypothetical protein MuYL_0941 [Mucilaginibacter xinganensis]